MQGEHGAPIFVGICGEMEGWVTSSVDCFTSTATERCGYRYLQGMAQDLKDAKRKHRGIKGVFCVDKHRDAIQAYRKRVDDLKMDFLVCFYFRFLVLWLTLP